MLKKLLRYDLKFLFRYWWIAAVASLPASVMGGFAIKILTSETPKTGAVLVAVLMILATILTIVAVAVMPIIMIAIRFYKNLYSDEGYLTFTLPVSRANLLNSKIISSFIIEMASVLTVAINVLLMAIIAGANFSEIFQGYVFRVGDGILALAFVLLFSLLVVSSTLLMFVCISVGAVITKKHKVLAAIGIYYGVSGFVSGFSQLFVSLSSGLIVGIVLSMKEDVRTLVGSLMALPIILIIAAVVVGLYTLVHWIMDRKLNLS